MAPFVQDSCDLAGMVGAFTDSELHVGGDLDHSEVLVIELALNSPSLAISEYPFLDFCTIDDENGLVV